MDAVKANTLVETVRKVVMSYATEGYNQAGEPDKLHYVENPQEQVFAVLEAYNAASKHGTLVAMVRLVAGMIIIDENKTDVSLKTELVQAGIPDSQIVFAGDRKPQNQTTGA